MLYEESIVAYEASVDTSNSYLIAFDEVGRGSVFGPVTVAGVLCPLDLLSSITSLDWYEKIGSSKKLSATRRTELSPKIQDLFLTKVTHIGVNYIEKYNINQAIYKGMLRITKAFLSDFYSQKKDIHLSHILVDGNYNFTWPLLSILNKQPQIINIIRGDELCFSIACASIIAKVTRDNMISKASLRFTSYALEKNKGYGTKEHFQAISMFGLTHLHRKSYLRRFVSSSSTFFKTS